MNVQPHEQTDSKQANTASLPHTMLHLERNSINYSVVYSVRPNALEYPWSHSKTSIISLTSEMFCF